MEGNVEKLEKLGKEAILTKYNQIDFFVADVIDAAPKGERHSMEHPMFSLSKTPDRTIRNYENGDCSVTITPSVLGAATIWDKDLLLYCSSQITEALNRDQEVSRRIKVDSYAILTASERGTGGQSYDQLIEALKRLEGTRISTNIKAAGFRESRGFGLIDSWAIADTHPKTGRVVSVEITLSEWLFRALVSREVLTFNREYFRLKGGLERRLYELARKHCGKQKNGWPISLVKLFKKSGAKNADVDPDSAVPELVKKYRASLRRFRADIKKMAAHDSPIPDYIINYDSESEIVTFMPAE